MINIDTPWLRKGAACWVTFSGKTTHATAVIASADGRSAALVFDDMLGGYVMMMPLLWNDGDSRYEDLINGQPVVVTPYPS